MKLLITGGTGFLGATLIPLLLKNGHELALLTRNPKKAVDVYGQRVQAIHWNAESDLLSPKEVEWGEGVIHLAGENVAGGRWSSGTKKRIYESRVLSGNHLVQSFAEKKIPLSVFISASAIGYYGDRGDELLNESSSRGRGFLAGVCEDWENAVKGANAERIVTFRIGVILGKNGGALEKILPIFRGGLGGKVGSGKQWMSWVHVDDVAHLILKALGDSQMKGVYNAVSPNPVRNETFTEVLGRTLHKPTLVPVPAMALKLGFGEMATETVLASQRVQSERLSETGFSHRYPDLEDAIKSVL